MITKKPGSNFVLVFFFGIFLLTILFLIEDANAEIKFKEVTEEAGVYYFGDSYGSYWGNFNEDEFADLWTPNHGKAGSPRLYVNNGDGTFLNSTFKIPNALLKLDKHGSAWLDFDNDGFIDIFVTNGGGLVGIKQGGPNQLFKNLGNKNNWLEIDLIGKKSNKDGIGSRVLLTAGKITQLREQAGGFHYRAQNHDRIHFGLGNNTNIDQILIFWPSGIIQAMKNVEINQSLKIFEPTKSISPLKQIKFWIDHLKINCNDGLVLIPKFNGKFSACVKKESFEKLMERSRSKIN